MTINEIAKLAGVSASTVSKIMNNKRQQYSALKPVNMYFRSQRNIITSPMLLSIPPEPSRLYVSALYSAIP